MAKQRIPNGKYTKEFREEAVKMIADLTAGRQKYSPPGYWAEHA